MALYLHTSIHKYLIITNEGMYKYIITINRCMYVKIKLIIYIMFVTRMTETKGTVNFQTNKTPYTQYYKL